MNENYKESLSGFYHSNKRMPTYSEMMKLFGFKSKNAVFRVVEKMIEAGIVAKDAMGRLIPDRILSEVPMLGTIKAGFPSPAEETRLDDSISLDDFLIAKKESTYVLEVDGDSMIDAHIEKGDLVVAERTEKAQNGQIVIAEVDGEFTMKYFRKSGDKIWLEAANKNYEPIYPEYDLKICAVVKGVIRKY
jgi:repressor LexA